MNREISFRNDRNDAYYKHFKTFEIRAAANDKKEIELSFSSEEPYTREYWDGEKETEILGHAQNEVRLDFLASGNAPFLEQHNHEKQIGVIGSAVIDPSAKKGRAVIRFSSGKAGEEAYKDVLEGIRKNISVGYRVHKVRILEEEPGHVTYRAVDWEPFEISLVSVPADKTVGIGRGIFYSQYQKGVGMPPKGLIEENVEQTTETETVPEVIPEEEKSEELIVPANDEKERSRCFAIAEIGRLYGSRGGIEKAAEAISNGTTVEIFRKNLLKHLSGKRPVASENTDEIKKARQLDIDRTEFIRKYSLRRAINAMLENRPDDAGYEFEISKQLSKHCNVARKHGGIIIPAYMPFMPSMRSQEAIRAFRTAMTTGGGAIKPTTTGGNLVNLEPLTFYDALQERSVLAQLGITSFSGLSGDFPVARKTSASSGGWIGEGDNAPEQSFAFGRDILRPHTVAAYTKLSRQMLQQSSIDVEMNTRNDILNALSVLKDKGALYGTGSDDQPTGVINITGVVAFDLDNANKASYDEMVDIQAESLNDFVEVESTTKYLCNPTFAANLKKEKVDAGSGIFVLDKEKKFQGVPVLEHTIFPAGYLLYGPWSNLIEAQWGFYEMFVDRNVISGEVTVSVFGDYDFTLKQPGATIAATKPASS